MTGIICSLQDLENQSVWLCARAAVLRCMEQLVYKLGVKGEASRYNIRTNLDKIFSVINRLI